MRSVLQAAWLLAPSSAVEWRCALPYTDWKMCGAIDMELTLEYVNNGTAEIASSSMHPNLRLFAVPHMNAEVPARDTAPAEYPTSTNIACTNRWMVSSPAAATNFSAVCYLTLKRLAEMSHAPTSQQAPVIGMIHAPYGGTPIEAWSLPEGGLKDCAAVGETGVPFSGTTPWGRAFVGTPWCKVRPDRRFALPRSFPRNQLISMNDSLWHRSGPRSTQGQCGGSTHPASLTGRMRTHRSSMA